MKQKRLIMIELEQENENTNLDKNRYFLINYQKVILLSLLEKKQLTRWQFDRCCEELLKA